MTDRTTAAPAGQRVLALAAEAWGGRGGIAQSTRDLLGALAAMPGIGGVEVLPRHACAWPTEKNHACAWPTENAHALAWQTRAPHTRASHAQPPEGGAAADPRCPRPGERAAAGVADPALPAGVEQLAPVPGRLAYGIRALVQVLGRRGAARPDIVYCGHAFMAPLAWAVARLSGAQLAVHLHGVEIWAPLSAPVRHALRAADLLYCVSGHTAGKAIDAVGADPQRCVVVFNTVAERFQPGPELRMAVGETVGDGTAEAARAAARAGLGLAPGAVVLSTVSRLDPGQRHKGHDRVIPLLAGLAQAHPGLVYLVAGTGGDRARLAALAEAHGVGDRVRFLGHVAAAELPDLYRASDLYVMPSHGEGFGIAFIEAMACGTPALGLDAGGAGEALRDGTLGRAVTEAAFPAALAETLAAVTAGRAGEAVDVAGAADGGGPGGGPSPPPNAGGALSVPFGSTSQPAPLPGAAGGVLPGDASSPGAPCGGASDLAPLGKTPRSAALRGAASGAPLRDTSFEAPLRSASGLAPLWDTSRSAPLRGPSEIAPLWGPTEIAPLWGDSLAARTRALFGRPVFEARVAAATAPLLTPSSQARKAIPT